MLRTLALVSAAALALTACSDSSDARRADQTPTETVTVTSAPTVDPITPEPQPSRTKAPKPDPLAGMFPKGFPKKVPVSEIPYPVNSAFEGRENAVQLAPGVWTSLDPGATIVDAALSDTADGFCSSIMAFERKWRGGDPLGGSCW